MLISVIGGDIRFLYTAKRLEEAGHTVLRCATAEDNCTLSQALKAAAIVLPLPVSRDGITLCAPHYNQSIPLCDVISQLDGNQLLLGGITKINYGNYYDYYNNQEFLYKNSAITAEGAIQTALSSTDYALLGSRILIVGYGRLGKALTKRLLKFECRLTVSARRHAHFEQISHLGVDCVNTAELDSIINGFDIIFNTVPHQVLTRNTLQKAKKDALFIELASAPYGIDIKAAKELDINLINLPSLPSRCAPKSAGIIIADAVNDIIHAV